MSLVVDALRARGIRPDQIGIIAPYSAQVARLKAALRPASGGSEVEVATVNAFQGRDNDVIVASFVRSNPDQDLGFVADERRLTVALTRAKRQLVLVGDSATLSAHPRFAALCEAIGANGGLVSVWEPPWDEAMG